MQLAESGEGHKPAYRLAGKEKIKVYEDKEVEVDKWQVDESADGYRIPRDLEWEYACRAGSETPWSPGNERNAALGILSDVPIEAIVTMRKQASECMGFA